jgi:uncharacterized glyoxalase superfamily metalloenzyme YdcJ
LYQDLCAAGFKIAADIACFESHHLNHLTPNTLGMDLYTAAMKHAMGERDAAAFRDRATVVLARLRDHADHDYLRLHFKHLSPATIANFTPGRLPAGALLALVEVLAQRLQQPDLALAQLPHAGFKDYTEGPAEDTPVLLRHDAYKALTEPVQFTQPDGSVVNTVHTARFGEIEQRFYATTPRGRDLYDRCLDAAEAAKEQQPGLVKKDMAAYERLYAAPFAAFPKRLSDLLEQNLVYGRYTTTETGRAAARAGGIATVDFPAMVKAGYVAVEGLRYEDFLPVSAAGIFASNLNQYGTKSTATQKPVYSRAQLEEILGRKIVDPDVTYAGLDAESRWQVCTELGLLEKLEPAERARLQQAITAFRQN